MASIFVFTRHSGCLKRVQATVVAQESARRQTLAGWLDGAAMPVLAGLPPIPSAIALACAITVAPGSGPQLGGPTDAWSQSERGAERSTGAPDSEVVHEAEADAPDRLEQVCAVRSGGGVG